MGNTGRRGEERRLDERGQTLQDYALGIGLFSLVVVGVLSGTFTSVLAPYDDGVGAGKQAQADRIADQILANESVLMGTNETVLHPIELSIIAGKNQTELRDRYDVPNTSRINISVHEFDGSVVSPSFTTDRGPGEQPAATSTRIVRVPNPAGIPQCRPACRLVVRVW